MSSSTDSFAASLADIRAAHARIRDHVHRTPVHTSRSTDARSGRKLFFKCENLQRIGAFKMRGALNAVLCLPQGQAEDGVVTHSSGNFAQALALSARIRGIPAHIVMPSNAPEVKKRAVEGYGGRIVLCEPNARARAETAARVGAETGATFVHPFDDPAVIAGQGTVALELFEQAPDLEAVVVPVGGGGLISGIALAYRELNPAVRILAAEPRGADDAWRSCQAGEWLMQEGPDTIADGLLTSLGEWTWPVVRDV
ncbi:MAG: pyridoxal-phosphate dependent enzyme, partial [Myxococcota bacterium]|nr:pyridoxal-phosphate dependent enzyme [Myxococcota bacterium]